MPSRFRTFFPDAYKQYYPNAKTHLSSKVRSTLPDGASIFEKTRSNKRRPFTLEEDAALRAGYEKHGTVWSTTVKDPIFQEQKRCSTDLRDPLSATLSLISTRLRDTSLEPYRRRRSWASVPLRTTNC